MTQEKLSEVIANAVRDDVRGLHLSNNLLTEIAPEIGKLTVARTLSASGHGSFVSIDALGGYA